MAKKRPGTKFATKTMDVDGASSAADTSAMEEEDFGLDPQIVFEVEGVLFGLPRSQVMASEVFRDMLNDEHLGSPREGTEENPIRMEKISQVSLSQVKAFHKVMNCRSVFCSGIAEFWSTMLIHLGNGSGRRFDAEPTLSVKQWSEALQLATKWGFKTLRKFIIEHLDSLLNEPLSRIELADQCNVKEWLHPAYAKLCAQETPLTVNEGKVLGLERFAALCRIREEELKSGGYRGGSRSEKNPMNSRFYPGFKGYRDRYNDFDDSELVQEVRNCQRQCCKPSFQLDEREKAFLAKIAQAEDL
ncbi:hypothetical protein FRC04_002154 [Tulasnella sp. 424]|nr:hypothetical protein FRC04_002154 [Tulasnella sp. 424]KAG8967797.1 hypothetical protein FRC05_001893 [Tulasnella sp. 425]